jgi:hypothetical protein
VSARQARRRPFGVAPPLALTAAAVALTVLAAGCTKKRAHVDGTVAVDSVLARWTSDSVATGAEAESVKEVDPTPWNAGACSQGQVGTLEVLLCEYASDEALGQGEQQINKDWAQAEEGVATGVVARAKRTLLAITDRTGADKSGHAILKLLKSFRAQN